MYLNGEEALEEINRRRVFTVKRIEELRLALKEADAIAAGKACVYATGSYGRCEASEFSDLDIFIVGKNNGRQRPDGKEGSQLSQLDEICIKADLIEISRKLKFPDFTDDGKYLIHYSLHDFTKTLGTPEDDVTNTFTARLLLLLESCALIGEEVYQEIAGDVFAQYWRDYGDHRSDFMPAFLANDILRLWRTFCVNYEARTDREPDIKKAKGKIKNYKLKHSRLLTCYSAVLYLLGVYGKNSTVSPQDALYMFGCSPTQRIEDLASDPAFTHAAETLRQLLDQYEQFLISTNVAEADLVTRFRDHKESSDMMAASKRFGDLVFKALNEIGKGNAFHRMLVV